MKISYNWLKNYVDFNLSPKDLGEVLTGVGLEVEGITPFETVQGGLEGVVVGEVVECNRHPDADKLSVTRVDVGSGELLQIVCGAPNVAAGQKVAVALVGSTLYPAGGEKLSIKKAKIRGVESFGMICAEDELGLGQSHNGIMVLNADTKTGTKASEYFKVEKDYVLDIGLTPNRGDANSHIGVARDVAAALNVAYKSKVTFTKPDLSGFKTSAAAQSKITVSVLDAGACPRYSGVLLTNVKVEESPDWLKNKLKAIEVRPVNNVVDITNYVLHEYGQPLHAFDADKIRGNKVIVKKLPEGTPFKTLDAKEIKLSADDLMICDGQGGMCIAGVFGGYESGVSNATTSIFLESAYFSPAAIRKTATKHSLRTDAAMHFEKGTDPNGTIEALKRAALLISEIAGGTIASEVIDVYPEKIEGWRFEVSYERMLRLAGFSIEKEIVNEILQRLEIKIEKEADDTWYLFVPAFKTDVKREADVVEEILRIYGYNSFALPKAVKSSLVLSPKIEPQKLENTIAEMLSGAGFSEIWTNSITTSKNELDEQLRKQQVKLLNSQSADLDSLRTSMLYSGLEVIAHNQNRKNTNLRFYEFGTVYLRSGDKYDEQKHLAIFLTGNETEKNWLQPENRFGFYHLKSFVINVLAKLGHHNFEKEIAEKAPFSYSMVLRNEGVDIVRIGDVRGEILSKFDIRQDVFYADLNWSYLLQKSEFNKIAYAELPKFPAVKRDLAIVVDENLQFESIERIAKAEAKKLFQQISLFDVYKGDKIEKGKKSCAVSLLLQNPDKTLTDQEVEKIMSKIMAKLESELGALIRRN